MNRVCITGGAGYVGAVLCKKLLREGFWVTILDTCWYWPNPFFHEGRISKNTNKVRWKVIQGDIRDRKTVIDAFKGQDAVIHLACISNDPSFELNPNLGRQINYDAFANILYALKACQVDQFIYASSSSVYGIKNEPNVTEEMSCEPLTDYSKFKLMCEEDLKKESFPEHFSWTIVRPATVCGYSMRMRLDLVVNLLTMQAISEGEITVLGGNQLRPNIHVQDMTDAYMRLLKVSPRIINRQTFNVGYENMSVASIAELIKKHIPETKIRTKPSNDNRSYHVNSDKITQVTGFKPRYSVEDAIKEIIAYEKQGFIQEPFKRNCYHNIKALQELINEGKIQLS